MELNKKWKGYLSGRFEVLCPQFEGIRILKEPIKCLKGEKALTIKFGS